MPQANKVSFIARLRRPLTVQIVDLNMLKQHEEVDPIHLRELQEEIRSDGILKLAIVVDANTKIVLDGEHRFSALKELGCKKIPAVLVDYDSSEITVQAWRKGENWTKKDVRDAGFSGQKLPPMTTKHMIRISNRLRHISAVEKQVNIALEKLRGDADDRG